MKQVITFILLILFGGTITAQTIDFYFPYLAGSEYSFHLNRGTVNDTIQRGTIGADGRLSFTLPEKDKEYVGMVHWALNPGGGQSFVLNKENFSVSCMKPNPTENDIIFLNSKENTYLKDEFRQQQALFGKVDAIYRAKTAYADDPSLYPVFEKEFSKLQSSFDAQQKAVAASPLYAARYIQMIGFLNGLGPRLYEAGEEAQKDKDLIRYVDENLDMDYLYTSGLWNHIISSTFKLYTDKKAFGEGMVKNLKRIRSQQIFEALANDLITICEQYGWVDAENVIIPYLLESGKITNPQGKLYMAFELDKVKAGTKALPIKGQKKLSNTLLMFYESGCSNCNAQLEELKKNYPEIQKKGIRIVTISADTSPEVFEYHSKDFPWPDKICDYEGFDGENFHTYGVIGTPTFYLIDKNGIITGRYARLEDTGVLK
jgi:thiol-disulfide isomerase/thioredoxin